MPLTRWRIETVSVRISPGEISGRIRVPGSKSYTQRYVLISAFTNSSLHLSNVAFCDDDLRAISVAESCGKKVERSGNELWISGPYSCPQTISCGDSGTTLRLSLGLLSGRKCSTRIDLSEQLSSRPILPLIESLNRNGTVFTGNSSEITVNGSGVVPASSTIDGDVSSQFVSSLLLFQALMQSGKTVRVTGSLVSENYVLMTIDVMKEFGVVVKSSGSSFTVDGTFSDEKVENTIEGDYSSAAFITALGALASERGVTVEGLNKDSIQPDSLLFKGGFPGSWSKVDNAYRVSHTGIKKVVIDCNHTPDLAPVAAVLGIYGNDGALLLHVERLRTKESDRLSELVRLVNLFGGRTLRNGADLEIVAAASRPRIDELEFSDHRMIMAGIIAGIVSGQDIVHKNVELISKSYPGFLSDLVKIGVKVEQVR